MKITLNSCKLFHWRSKNRMSHNERKFVMTLRPNEEFVIDFKNYKRLQIDSFSIDSVPSGNSGKKVELYVKYHAYYYDFNDKDHLKLKRKFETAKISTIVIGSGLTQRVDISAIKGMHPSIFITGQFSANVQGVFKDGDECDESFSEEFSDKYESNSPKDGKKRK